MSSRQLLPSSCRGLHSPSLLACSGASNYPASHVVSLSGLNIVAGTSTVLDSGWAAMHYELKLPVGILTIFQRPLTVPLHSPDGGNCLPSGLCKETVKESTSPAWITWFHAPWSLPANICLRIQASYTAHWTHNMAAETQRICQKTKWSICCFLGEVAVVMPPPLGTGGIIFGVVSKMKLFD